MDLPMKKALENSFEHIQEQPIEESFYNPYPEQGIND